MSEVQLIDGDGDYIGGLDVDDGFEDCSDYGVVAVIGCQSSGKSSLLNEMYGTSFPVLDAPTQGRARTTLGVWAAVVTEGHPTVVLDVEGADSRERGEGMHSFESRTALFSIALADSLVINVWMHDVGRHEAANYDLLEIVFSQSKQIGHGGNKAARKTIVVAFRDFDEEMAELRELEKIFYADMARIWKRTNAASGLELSAVFDVKFCKFSHPRYFSEDFGKQANSLRKELVTTGPKKVPLGRFEDLAEDLWDSIGDKLQGAGYTLDLPEQMEMILRAECDAAKQVALEKVEEDLLDLRFSLEVAWREPITDFVPRVDTILRKAIDSYDGRVGKHRDKCQSYEVKKSELTFDILDRVRKDRTMLFNTAADKAVRNLEMHMEGIVAEGADFDRRVKRYRDILINEFRDTVAKNALPGDDAHEMVAGMGASLQLRLDDLVRERKQVREIVLGPESFDVERRVPWWKNRQFWKDILIRGAILAFNYWQATRQLNAMRAGNIKRDKISPTGPTF